MLEQSPSPMSAARKPPPRWTPVGEVPDINADYPDWLRRHTAGKSQIAQARRTAARWAYRPTLSVLAPHPGRAAERDLFLESLAGQAYGAWELCLAKLPGSKGGRLLSPEGGQIRERVKALSAWEETFWTFANRAAAGDFVVLLCRPGLLDPLALYEVVRLLNSAPEVDFIYADQDKVERGSGFRWDPFFKPDWSPDLLLSLDYVSDFAVYRRSLVRQVGGFRAWPDGAEGYDLALRVSEQARDIRHIPRVLFSVLARPERGVRRARPGPQDLEPSRQALEAAVQRRRLPAGVEEGTAPGRWRVRYELSERPGVTLIIPTGGKLHLLEPCLRSVLTGSTYPDLRILVVDNSEGAAVAELCAHLGRRDARLVRYPCPHRPFNYSLINNSAARLVQTPYLLLLNDDTTVLTPDWIEAMLEHAQRPEVGIVGARLLYPDDTIQHAGVIMGPFENTVHAFRHFPADDPGYFGLAQVVRNCSAVTFACALMRRPVYEEVGGLDEVNLRVAFNDTDMCLRVVERGYRIVYTPHAVLYHHESVTKATLTEPGEADYMRRRWRQVIRHDPYYSPNLTRQGTDYSLQGFAIKPPSADALGRGGRGSYRAQKLAHRFTYERLRERIRRVLAPLLSPAATVLVVGKGDDRLLGLGEWRGWHFPQGEDGGYAGYYPAHGDDAIVHLEALRSKGAGYLLFPATSFWWLDYYSAFRDHLDRSYRRVWDGRTCLLYDLTGCGKTRRPQ